MFKEELPPNLTDGYMPESDDEDVEIDEETQETKPRPGVIKGYTNSTELQRNLRENMVQYFRGKYLCLCVSTRHD